MTVLEIVESVAGILAILGVVVGLTRYVTSLQFAVKQERLTADNEGYEKRLANAEARYKELINQMATARRVGTAALTEKLAIDDLLASIMLVMQAQAGSIFIPFGARKPSEFTGLIFLSLLPLTQESASLRHKMIPLQSLAGRAFTSGEPIARPDSNADPSHYRKADDVSGFQTEDTISYPLRYEGKSVGVLQLLTKEGSEKFSELDIPRLESVVGPLAEKVAGFVRVPENLEILGIMPDREAEYASVMVCDMTGSRLLFQEMNASLAIQHLNEYLERLCELALQYGATVDKYTGDGVLLRFNVPRPVPDHSYAAVACAIEMQRAFEKLKKDWVTMGDPLKGLYNRIGIAFGPVTQAIIGHPQYQYLTILGQPVNVAANLCEAAPRDRDVIIIDELIYSKVQGRITANPLPKDKLGKAAAFIKVAYELAGVSSMKGDKPA